MSPKVVIIFAVCFAIASAQPMDIFGFGSSIFEKTVNGARDVAHGVVNAAADIEKAKLAIAAGLFNGVVQAGDSMFRIAFENVLSPEGATVRANSPLAKQCNTEACAARCPNFIFSCVERNLYVCAYCPMMTAPVKVLPGCNQNACLSKCFGFSADCVASNPQLCLSCPAVGPEGQINGA